MAMTMIRKFAQARAVKGETAAVVAGKLNITREYLYDVIKYPDKNRDIFKKACQYIESAGIDIDLEVIPTKEP